MQPHESEVRRGRRSRDKTPGDARSARRESVLLSGPQPRLGGGHAPRHTGPQAPAPQDYPGEGSPPWELAPGSPESYGDRYGNDGGYGYQGGNGYGNSGSYGNADGGYGYGSYRSGNRYGYGNDGSNGDGRGYSNGGGYGNGDGYGGGGGYSDGRGYGDGGNDRRYGAGSGTGPSSTGRHAGGGRQDVMVADAAGSGREQPSRGGAHRADEARSAWAEAAQRGYPPRQPATGPRNGDSVSTVARILSVADYEAASITQQASLQATMITQRVAYEATEIREAARREADAIMQQASLEAAAVREAAEIEAAEVHTAVASMQAELTELAERIRNTRPHPVLPPAQPKARPNTGPQERPQTRLQERRSTTGPQQRSSGPQQRRTTGPRQGPDGKPAKTGKPGSGQGRQLAAMRFAVIATSALFMLAVAAGVVEIHLHGWDFFVFRSTGTGETGRGPGGLQENQGPSQPDAPKAAPSQVAVRPSPHAAVTVHSGH